MPGLRGRRVGGGAEPLRDLRPGGDPDDRAGRDARVAARRHVPVLCQAVQGRGTGGPGAGLALRAQHPRFRDLPSRGAGHPAGAVARRAPRPVRPDDQRGRARQHAVGRRRAVQGRGVAHQGAPARRHRHRVRRDRGAGWPRQLVAVGVPSRRQRRLRRRRPSLQGGGGRPSSGTTSPTSGPRTASAPRRAGPGRSIRSAWRT